MKTHELRIGNYVYYNGNHKHISTVSSLQPKVYVEPYGAVCYSESIKVGLNNRFDIVYDVENVKPIPLTEEWLIKFGFEKVNGWYDYTGWFKDMVEIECDYNGYKFVNYLNLEIKHVHKLQNLYFALTNKELNNE